MSATPLRKLNVLVVDDDISIVRLVAKILEERFSDLIRVHTTAQPLDAQAWIDSNCCDILLTDIEMPEIDGMTMLRIAKRRNSWTAVVFLTGHSTWDRIAEAVENGASDYLLKPLDSQELIKVVSRECERVRRWQDAVRETLHTSPA